MSPMFRCCYPFLIVIICFVGGCQPGSTDPTPRYRISKAAETALNFQVTMTYQYDDLGRLTQVTEYPAIDTLAKAIPTAQIIVTYDLGTPAYIAYADRRLTTPYTDFDGLIVGTRRIFTYNGRGLPLVVTEYKAVGDFRNLKLSQTFSYTYDQTNELPAQLTVAGTGSLQERDVYTYTFLKGNAVHISLSVTTTRTNTPAVNESDVLFDDAPSVYYHYFAVYPGITSFNKNNVISSNTTLEHDERGLLVKRIKPGSYIDDITTYTYETY